MAETKDFRVRIRLDGGIVAVKALITHPMETGRRKDDDGKLIAAHFIQHIFAEYKGRRVYNAYWGTGVSKNPFIAFSFKAGDAASGDTVTLSWVDNLGQSGSTEATIS